MNYEKFYGFEDEPFSDIPDPNLFYSGPEHTRALVKLLHVIKKGRSLGLLTGSIGCGKTTISRRIIGELDKENGYHSGLMVLTHTDFGPLWFLKKMGELVGISVNSEEKTAIKTGITKKLYERYQDGISTVIIIDEANDMTDPDVLEELRGFLNLELQGKRLITFILCGMPETVDNLKKNVSLRQRVATVVNLPPLSLNSTREYVKYRIQESGVENEIFSEDSYKLIYDYTDGIPRLINVLCDNALLEGALLKKKVVEESIIKRVGDELLLRE